MGRVKRKTQYLVSIIPTPGRVPLSRLFSVFYPCLLGVVLVIGGLDSPQCRRKKNSFPTAKAGVSRIYAHVAPGSTPQCGATLWILKIHVEMRGGNAISTADERRKGLGN